MEPGSPPQPDRERAPGEAGYPHATWGPWIAIGGTVLALITGLLLALPILAATDTGDAEDLGGTARIGIQALTATGFIAVPLLIAYLSGLRLAAVPGWSRERLTGAFRALGFTRFRWGKAFKWAGIVLLGYLAFAMVWAGLFGAPEQEDIAGKLGPLWTQILLIVIAAPLAEEICFRGLLFGGIRTRASLPVAALAAGLIFGLLHYSTGWSTVPQLAVLGAAFAVIYDRTGSLWPPIIFHMINNAFVLATLN